MAHLTPAKWIFPRALPASNGTEKSKEHGIIFPNEQYTVPVVVTPGEETNETDNHIWNVRWTLACITADENVIVMNPDQQGDETWLITLSKDANGNWLDGNGTGLDARFDCEKFLSASVSESTGINLGERVTMLHKAQLYVCITLKEGQRINEEFYAELAQREAEEQNAT